MALTSKIHGQYGAIKIGASYIDQITSTAIRTNAGRMRLTDGVDEQFLAVISQRSAIEFSTTAIATALGIAGWNGAVLAPTSNEFTAWLRCRAAGGLYTAGSTHLRLVAKNGIVYPRRLSGDLSGAQMQFEVAPIWDGTNNPLIITASAALTGTPAVDEAFVVGPVKINGTQLEGVQSIDVDFGIALLEITADGNYWATFQCLQRRQPRIEILSVDALSLNTFGLTGTAQGATDSTVYFKQVDQNGLRKADGAGSHVKISVDDGMIFVEDLSADVDSPFRSRVTIDPTWDGTNATLAIQTGQTIT